MFLDTLCDGSQANKTLATLYSDSYKTEIRFEQLDNNTIKIVIWDSVGDRQVGSFTSEARDVESVACSLVNALRV